MIGQPWPTEYMASDMAGGTDRGFNAMAFSGHCGWLSLTVLVAFLQSADHHRMLQSVPIIFPSEEHGCSEAA